MFLESNRDLVIGTSTCVKADFFKMQLREREGRENKRREGERYNESKHVEERKGENGKL